MKEVFSVIAIAAIIFTFGACKKKEEQPTPKVTMKGPIIESPSVIPGHESAGQKIEFQVIVPPEVKEEWSGVKLIVEDKKLENKKEIIVKIGEDFKIPGSNLTLKVGHFLPDFKMSGQFITSTSNNPNNPSVGIAVYEDGEQIFPKSGEWGWLYAKFPTIHPFQHERYGLLLKEGIKK